MGWHGLLALAVGLAFGGGAPQGKVGPKPGPAPAALQKAPQYEVKVRLYQRKPGQKDELIFRPTMVLLEGQEGVCHMGQRFRVDVGGNPKKVEHFFGGITFRLRAHRLENGKLRMQIFCENKEVARPFGANPQPRIRLRTRTLEAVEDFQFGKKLKLTDEAAEGLRLEIEVLPWLPDGVTALPHPPESWAGMRADSSGARGA